MKLTFADLPKIQLSLIAALASAALAAALVIFSLNAEKTALSGKNAASQEFREFDGKLKQVRNEEAEIKLKAALFEKLQARGIIGEERRLDWIELLKRIQEQRRLADLNYEISAQRPLDTTPGSELAYYVSSMTLHVKLLHEEDLTRLLADLRSQAQALILVRSCRVSRLAADGGDRTGKQANLLADCEIDWITVRAPAPQ